MSRKVINIDTIDEDAFVNKLDRHAAMRFDNGKRKGMQELFSPSRNMLKLELFIYAGEVKTNLLTQFFL